jgi:transposase-like protein
MEKRKTYSKAFRDEILTAYFTGNESGTTLAKRFSIRAGLIHVWAQRYRKDFQHLLSGESPDVPVERPPALPPSPPPVRKSAKPESVNALEKRVAELERELEYERMRSRTYETLIDVAERDLQIQIKKKSGAKP